MSDYLAISHEPRPADLCRNRIPSVDRRCRDTSPPSPLPGLGPMAVVARIQRVSLYRWCQSIQGWSPSSARCVAIPHFPARPHVRWRLPRLDNLRRLDELAKLPYRVPDELVRAILATCFFFKLDEVPTRLPSRYHCRGSVLCAQRGAQSIIQRVRVEFPGAELQSIRGDHLRRLDIDKGCATCRYYQKRVDFCIGSLDEEVSLQFTSAPHQQAIGGFLTTI